LEVDDLKKRVEVLEKRLKGKTFARFKYVTSLYKYIKDIYAKINSIKKRLDKLEKG
jgi:hypothetical protein